MLTEAVLDGSQAMRDPVGGSVEFHFVPILKLISTLLMMGIFNDEDTKHILKMIDPHVFSGKKEEKEEEEKAEEVGAAEKAKEGEERKEEAEKDLEDEGVGDEEEEIKDLGGEHKAEDAEFKEEGEVKEEGEAKGVKVDGEKAKEEKEAEAVEAEVKDEEEGLEEGLLQMKLPESVKLQVIIFYIQTLPFICMHLHSIHILTISVKCVRILHLKLFLLPPLPLSDVHTAAVLLRLRAATQSGGHRGLFRPVCQRYSEEPTRTLQPVNESLHHVGC